MPGAVLMVRQDVDLEAGRGGMPAYCALWFYKVLEHNHLDPAPANADGGRATSEVNPFTTASVFLSICTTYYSENYFAI